MGYLTPNTVPADTICRVLFIPNDSEFLANVTGALQLLTFAENWQLYGTLTPEEAAAALVPMFDQFCFNQGACRVIGEIIAFAGGTSPDSRWLICDGASLLRVDYPDLFVVIGTTYGAADSTHFNLPDLRDNVIIGAGAAYALGAAGGEAQHTLTVAEIPSHSHNYTSPIPVGTAVPPPLDASLPNPFPTASSSTGGDGAHNNLQPYLAINYLIVALT